MNLIKNESAQAGGITTFVAGLLIVGFFIVAFGAIMDQIQDLNNDLISNADMDYSKDHQDAAVLNLDFWGGMAIYAIIVFAIWAIKNALKRDDNII